MKQTSMDYRRERLRQIRVDRRFKMNEDERRSAMNAQNIKESLERILNMRVSRASTRAQIEVIKKQAKSLSRDIKLKDLDIKLKEVGIYPGDSAYYRILNQLLRGSHFSATRKNVGDKLTKEAAKGTFGYQLLNLFNWNRK